ncbi:hypothetical protein V2G26_001155 [Clonostachys chloroleuca]
MPGPRKDNSGGNAGRPDGRGQNGNRGGFQTDSSISNSRFGHERTLQRWMPDANDAIDGSLEKSSNTNTGGWDQFAANKELFGLTTDYDENIYTTAINRSHPQYRERIAAAEKKAREIERSVASTAHVAEERVMDYVAGSEPNDDNEEDKYSGVRRQGQAPLAGRENKYTPPAKRAPAAHSTVKGAPVDPAIISSQIKVSGKKTAVLGPSGDGVKNGAVASNEKTKPAQAKNSEEKTTDATASAQDAKVAEKASPSGRPSTNGKAGSPKPKPSATSTVERDVLKEFKTFANQQRENAQKVRSSKAKADKEVKLTELKKFANSFKLSTPVPTDLVSIIAKDPAKQKEIQAKALKNAEEVARTKAETSSKDTKPTPAATSGDTQTKPAEQPPAKHNSEPRAPRAPNAPQGNTQGGPQNRHPGHRQQYTQQPYQYRNNRGPHHIPPQQQTGNLAQRIRNAEQHKFSQPLAPHQHIPGQETRPPPTGPANNVDQSFNRRLSGVPSHMGAKLNPNSHEFRPGSFISTLNQNGHPSASSSPRSGANNPPEHPAAPPTAPAPATAGGQLIRRKTKAVDVGKCFILAHIKTLTPPQGRNWDENGGLRPAYDTLPTWRQLQVEENKESTMHLTYAQHFERQPFGGSTMATPNPPHVVPHIAHQHQLPFHLQQGGHNMGPRQSPHLAQMQMHTPQHGPGPHQSYGHDDHRMVHSNSAQSFASPRLGQVAMAYPGMNSPGQVPYHQPVFMSPGTPQMNYRSFSNNPQYMPQGQPQLGGHMMMQPHFPPQGMVGGPQMMYPGAPPHFMTPGGPPQPAPGANGYPSPGRPAAPMMTHQGSQQGQPMYGMSPNVGYSQPAFAHGQPGGPISNTRGYNNAGPQHFGTSPQQPHQFGHHPQRRGSSSYNKNYGDQTQNQKSHPASQATSQPVSNRVTNGSDEAK